MSQDAELLELLRRLEAIAKRRIVQAATRSPDNLYEEMVFLEEVIDLQRKLTAAR